jgi:hypothetical protein
VAEIPLKIINLVHDGASTPAEIEESLVHGGVTNQITSHFIRSILLHSESEGWLPAVMIEITDDDGNMVVGSVRAHEAVTMAQNIIDGAVAALADLEAIVPNRPHIAGGKSAPSQPD